MSKPSENRRGFLKAMGVTMAIPMLESVQPAQAAVNAKGGALAKAPAKRLACIGSNLGYYRPAFYPKDSGRKYKMSRLLSHVANHRNDFTVFSGLDHRAGNGHNNWDNFLCGPKLKSITLDQIAAEKIGPQTRFPSFQLCAGGKPGIQKLSYNRQGVPLPMTQRPSVVYSRMFASAEDKARTEYLLKSRRSSIDAVLAQANDLKRHVSGADKRKLDEYFTSVREVETRIGRQLKHLKADTVKVDYELPSYDPVAPNLMIEAQQIMYDLMALAFQTDSTRITSMFLAGLGQVFTLEGQTLRAGYHALSHHGGDKGMIEDLLRVEKEHMKCLDRFLKQLKTKTDHENRPLLDTTIVLFGTGMGDASRHSNQDLPTLVAGGGFKHGQHIKTNPKGKNAPLLGDLYITLLNQLGVETDRFANAKRGLKI